ETQVTPELLSPQDLCQHARVVRGARRFTRRRDHSLEGPINFGATRSIRPQERPSPSNPRRARRTLVAPPLAISSLALFVRLPSARADRVVTQASEKPSH